MVFKLLAVRHDTFVIPTTSGMHINEILNSFANWTSSLCRDCARLRVTQDFLRGYIIEEMKEVINE